MIRSLVAVVVGIAIVYVALGAAIAVGQDFRPPQWQVLSGVGLGQICDASFVDQRRGWLAFSDGSLLVSTDGGENWRSVSLPELVDGPLKVQLLRREDESCFGWAVGTTGRIYHTNDGTMWERQKAPVEDVKHRVGGVDVLDDRHAWIYGYGLTWQTTDGGETWRHLGPGEVEDGKLPPWFSTNEEHRFAHFRDESDGTALVATDFGWMTRTTSDAGRTWRREGKIRPYRDDSASLAVFRSGRAVRVYSGGELLYADGELPLANDELHELLDRTEAPGGYTIRSRHDRRFWVTSRKTTAALENLHGLGGHTATLLITTDGGERWLPRFTSSELSSIQFADRNNGWAVGAAGRVSRTADGGDTWIHTFLPTDAYLFSVFFLDAKVGWAGGGYTKHGAYGHPQRGPACIWRTEDGGANWRQVAHIENGRSGEHSHPETVRGLMFDAEENGWVVTHGTTRDALEPINDSTPREYGRVLRTIDGGRTWNQVYLGTPLRDITMRDGRWCAAGYRVVISDDGENWTNRAAESPLFGIAFADAHNVFVVGESGIYGSSGDGGRDWTWPQPELFRGMHLDAVAFGSPAVGWIGGSRPPDHSHVALFGTGDGGQTWHLVSIDRPNALGHLTNAWRDISAVDSQTAWAVSNNVMIRIRIDEDRSRD
jgi:photosystem II stability/assembly factor-like uncharacterized protein